MNASSPAPDHGHDHGWHLAAGRALAVAVLPALVLTAVGPLPLLVWRDRLPDPMASHWGISGGPNGSTGYGAMLTITLGAVVLATTAVGWVVF
ncbi:MAG: hypothetical protein OEY70_18595, partial [Acidimicrobiia bacterium]|nr:hypothetical protein [Acidimicrobiia bacterium]